MRKQTDRRTASEDEIAAVQYAVLVEGFASLLTLCGQASDARAFLVGATIVLLPFGIACFGVARLPPGTTRGVYLAGLSGLAFLGYLALALQPNTTSIDRVAYLLLCYLHVLGCAVILLLPARREGGRLERSPSVVVRGRFPVAAPIAPGSPRASTAGDRR